MVVNWVRAALFGLGGLLAAGGVAYVTGLADPWLGRSQTVVASMPADPAATDEAATEPGEPAAAEVPQPDAPVEPVQQADVVVPSFDLLRVEPDGSILIAGQSAPRAKVEVLSGEEVLAATDATAEGEFVAVFEEPLAPGDYQLGLRAITPEGVATTSEQTALVSIPDRIDGQVLALLDEPGAPSRLITVPEGEEVATGPADEAEQEIAALDATPSEAVADETVPAEPVAEGPGSIDEEPAELAEALPVGTPEADELSEVADELPDAAAPQDVAGLTEPATAEIAEGETVVAAELQAESELAETDAPGEPAGEDMAAVEGDELVPSSEAAPEVAAPQGVESGVAPVDTPETVAGEAVAEEAETEIAALPDTGTSVEAEPEPEALPGVVVEAVEIEGAMVFVAGRADAGRVVRVYANAIVLGETRASANGRFLVEARRELAVGDYIIRADLLAADGSVLARAAVPFAREEGESVAAVAPGVLAEVEAGRVEAAEPEAPLVAESSVVPEPVEPETLAQAPALEPEVVETEVVEAAPSAVAPEVAVQDPAEPETGMAQAPAIEEVSEPVAETSPTDVADTPAVESELPEASEEVAAEPIAPEPGLAIADAVEEEGTPDQEVAAAPKGDRVPVDETDDEATAPRLERVEGSVIIRRGDTLWHISRRVYGRGVRYSTIYLANRDQIRDPDRIWPGQVFSVPGETVEGEQADLSRIADQAVPPEEGEPLRQ